MGLSNFPSAADGVLPILVINTVHSVILLKDMFRFMLQIIGVTTTTTSTSTSSNMEQEQYYYYSDHEISSSRDKRVSITHFKSLCDNNIAMLECCCCVCLSRFEANEEVSELSCKHFFHRGCLDKWFDNKHTTCPLCRSID
ncbi:PREDICTED: probable E3 ubiquitin-protein ligase XERICO [Lupinus angustifolius]|uniref:probable E3 ubiquitin-protein ligase XERICO n=1 Tax=Lupinus angustifolius TaxID=3871 RepID=UPI00092E945F|nr:PREDICTED: probable E3 ubiquitin-protein ligase XERICO [Lupinus angustifolius]